jgi:hypothetical protein
MKEMYLVEKPYSLWKYSEVLIAALAHLAE